ncbi:MAG: hypothetical protein QM802_07245 [Agriterribacter sp.]
MKVLQSIFALIISSTISIICNNQNHIDRYKVDIEELKTLPDNFYAFRRGNLYYGNEKYRIWFTKTLTRNVKNIMRIEDLQNGIVEIKDLALYNIDTNASKNIAQHFIDLSGKFKFGHIMIDKKNKISFSYRDGLFEQYVKALNDSVINKYKNNKNFRLLENGWFEWKEE